MLVTFFTPVVGADSTLCGCTSVLPVEECILGRLERCICVLCKNYHRNAKTLLPYGGGVLAHWGACSCVKGVQESTENSLGSASRLAVQVNHGLVISVTLTKS